MSHNFIRLSFKEAKLNFCKLCSYHWFGEMITSTLFWTFSKSSHRYFGREWWKTCEQFCSRGRIHVQKKFRMSAVGTLERFSKIRKYIRWLVVGFEASCSALSFQNCRLVFSILEVASAISVSVYTFHLFIFACLCGLFSKASSMDLRFLLSGKAVYKKQQ